MNKSSTITGTLSAVKAWVKKDLQGVVPDIKSGKSGLGVVGTGLAGVLLATAVYTAEVEPNTPSPFKASAPVPTMMQ